MGLGRVHYERHAPKWADGAGGGADVQLVELVCEGGQSAGQARGADEQAAAAVRGGAGNANGWQG
jgi:hypothetical protein